MVITDAIDLLSRGEKGTTADHYITHNVNSKWICFRFRSNSLCTPTKWDCQIYKRKWFWEVFKRHSTAKIAWDYLPTRNTSCNKPSTLSLSNTSITIDASFIDAFVDLMTLVGSERFIVKFTVFPAFVQLQLLLTSDLLWANEFSWFLRCGVLHFEQQVVFLILVLILILISSPCLS